MHHQGEKLIYPQGLPFTPSTECLEPLLRFVLSNCRSGPYTCCAVQRIFEIIDWVVNII